VLFIVRPLAVGCLALTLFSAAYAGNARTGPGAPMARRMLPGSRGYVAPARSSRGVASSPPLTAPGWPRFTYGGASGAGQTTARIPGYSLAYPPRWTGRLWPDTLAGYGQLDLQSPSGSDIDVALIPLRPRGPALADLVSHDLSYLPRATRDTVALPLGPAVRLTGAPTVGGGRSSQILYLRRGAVVFRLYASRGAGSPDRDALVGVASTLRVLAVGGATSGVPMFPAAPRPPEETCCHCPAWGPGWGAVLTSLDGVPVYSNAGDGNNGCAGTYGILYQCVELAQRYFTLRWGYPAIWGGVAAAVDMRANHPGGIEFVPNGGSPGPREGDALLFYGGAFGHVAVVSGVDRLNGRIDIVEENWSPTGTSSLPIYADNTIGIRDGAYGSYSVAGWLHSSKNTSPAAP
jgi:hypothetical protein